MDINFNDLVESFINCFIQQCQLQVIPRDAVEAEMNNGQKFYNIAFPKADLYGLLKSNALKFYYLCRGRNEVKQTEFIHALVKINPGHENAVVSAYHEQLPSVCKPIEDERHLKYFIMTLQNEYGSRPEIIHYDHVVPQPK